MWLGIGVRLLVTSFFLLLLVALNRCSPPNQADDYPPTVTTEAGVGRAWLHVEVEPRGAEVAVDGLRSGTTPVSLEVSAGSHEVQIALAGYESFAQTVEIAAGGEAVISGQLNPLASGAPPTAPPTANPGQSANLPDLAIRQARIELESGGSCDYASTELGVRVTVENAGDADAGPFVVEVNGVQQRVEEGLAAGESVALWFAGYGSENTIIVDATSQVEESDEGNNRLSQPLPVPTLPAPCTLTPVAPPTGTVQFLPLIATGETRTPTPAAPPTGTPTPPAAVTVREEQVTIMAYPYADHLIWARNETYNIAYPVLDRTAYEAANPSPAAVAFRAIVLENEYLKLTFLPDLGGRLYEVLFKPTGHRETYRNPVLKPSPWGPPEQGWWLAAGGFEWCLPVEEHGYEWGVPWTAQIRQDGQGATLLLRDTNADDRLAAEIAVRLEAGAASFTIRPRLENPTNAPLPVKYWTNALLAPGGQNAPSADLYFVLPEAVTSVTVHSRGDDNLPKYGERMPWPIVNGVDLSRLGNWNRWLGFFEDPALGEFIAIYDQRYDEGMVHVFSAGQVPGAKVFGFGWQDAIPSSIWTDDGSSYVEIHGGPAPTFDDTVTLPAGGHLQWTETWYPVAGLGGSLRYANGTAALNLSAANGQIHAAVAVSRPWLGTIAILLNGQERWRQGVSLTPGQPFQAAVALDERDPESGRVTLRLEAPAGGVVAEYSADLRLK